MARKAKAISAELNKFVAFIEERYDGEYIIENNEDVLNRKLDVVKTGSLGLDICTGIGGIARGRITEIFGPESSGKTSLALSISKCAIEQGLNVLYVEPENSLD